jgi:hypothetical protein
VSNERIVWFFRPESSQMFKGESSKPRRTHLGANLPSPMVAAPGVRVFEIVPFKVIGRAVEPDFDQN